MQALENPFLLVVDPQRAFGEVVPVPSVERALDNMRRIVSAWRATGRPMLFLRHAYVRPEEVGRLDHFMPGIFDLLRDESPLSQFHEGLVVPGDPVVRKTRFSALVGTDVLRRIDATGASDVVVVGLTTPICVQATVDDLIGAPAAAKPVKRAAIYIRVSTHDQATRNGEPEGYSLPYQREACIRQAVELGAEVVAEYVDAGESAKTANRTQLKALVRRVEAARDIDLIIVHKINRLFRRIHDLVVIGGECWGRVLQVDLRPRPGGQVLEADQTLDKSRLRPSVTLRSRRDEEG